MKKKLKVTQDPVISRFIDRYNLIQNIGQSVEMPYDVWTTLGSEPRQMYIMGDQIQIGDADFKSFSEVRESIEWLVRQLGGSVNWDIEIANQDNLSTK